MNHHGSKEGLFRKQLLRKLNTLLRPNPKALRLLEFLENDPEVQSLIDHGNTLATKRLNYNDHGITHSRIASVNALSILELLGKKGISSTLEREGWGDHLDAQVVVLGGTYLHDIGNAVHRENHEFHGACLAGPLLRDFLGEIYPHDAAGGYETESGVNGSKADRIRASMLECIYSHDESVRCLSVEAGCVTAGDGADMANGRAREPFSRGKVDIHSVSALSIKAVKIGEGTNRPVRIDVMMTESAGVFQIQNILGKKLDTSGIMEYIEVVGKVVDEKDCVIDRIEFSRRA